MADSEVRSAFTWLASDTDKDQQARKTGTQVVTDAAGRSVTAGPITNIKVDKKAPALVSDGPTTQPNAAGWYKNAVTNGFKATDGGSGFAPSGDLTYSFNQSSGTNRRRCGYNRICYGL